MQREMFASLKSSRAFSELFREKEAMLDCLLRIGAGNTAFEDIRVRLESKDGRGMEGAEIEKEFPGYGVFKGRVTGFFVVEGKDDEENVEKKKGY